MEKILGWVFKLVFVTMFPVVQLAFVYATTSFNGMDIGDYLIGVFVPFGGWYLVLTRWAEYGFLNQ